MTNNKQNTKPTKRKLVIAVLYHGPDSGQYIPLIQQVQSIQEACKHRLLVAHEILWTVEGFSTTGLPIGDSDSHDTCQMPSAWTFIHDMIDSRPVRLVVLHECNMVSIQALRCLLDRYLVPNGVEFLSIQEWINNRKDLAKFVGELEQGTAEEVVGRWQRYSPERSPEKKSRHLPQQAQSIRLPAQERTDNEIAEEAGSRPVRRPKRLSKEGCRAKSSEMFTKLFDDLISCTNMMLSSPVDDEFPDQLWVLHYPARGTYFCVRNAEQVLGLVCLSTRTLTDALLEALADHPRFAEGCVPQLASFDEAREIAASMGTVDALILMDAPRDLRLHYVR